MKKYKVTAFSHTYFLLVSLLASATSTQSRIHRLLPSSPDLSWKFGLYADKNNYKRQQKHLSFYVILTLNITKLNHSSGNEPQN